jgi:hypothetical protein
VQLSALHPHWRVHLATGINPVQRQYHATTRRFGLSERLRTRLGDLSTDRALSDGELRAARALATEAYFDELEKTLTTSRTRNAR